MTLAYVGFESCGCATFIGVAEGHNLQSLANTQRGYERRGGRFELMADEEARKAFFDDTPHPYHRNKPCPNEA